VPELPEVETVVRDLQPMLAGRSILGVRRTSRHALRRPWKREWHKRLAGRQIGELSRRGKWIILPVDDGARLVVHLGMTGQLTVVSREEPRRDHTHFVFDLSDGRQLRYCDIRRFGSVSLFTDAIGLDAFFRLAGLGPEPFGLDAKSWRASLNATQRIVKAVLLDQTVVSGVGNIYADESLYVARLHPTRRACDLTSVEADRLRKAIAKVLSHAIERRGSSIRNYVGGSGLQGGYQREFRAYGRTGEPCSRCRAPIACLRLAGRSSHFCPCCQPPTSGRETR
jgi:formamidopyrimidine-DNA glycosylase